MAKRRRIKPLKSGRSASKKTPTAKATSKILPKKRRNPKKVKRSTKTPPKKTPVKKTPKRPAKTPVKKTKTPVKKTKAPVKKTKTPVKKTPKRPTKAPVKKTPKRPAKAPVKKTPKRPAKAPVKETPKRPAKTPVKKTPKRPAKKTPKRPAKKTPKRPAKAPVKKTPKRPAKKPAKAPAKAPVDKPPKRPTKAPAPIEKAPKRPAKAPAEKTPKPPVKATPKPLSGEQAKAKKTLLGYINRLGKRKAARRLDTTVAEVEKWLRKGEFPKGYVPEIIGLGEIGGGFTTIKGTSLAKTLKKLGAKALSTLTGVPVERLKQLQERNSKAKIKIGRKQLAEFGPKIGWEKLAKTLGVEPGPLKTLAKHPQTDATFRLREFVSEHGEDLVSYYIGLTPHHLKKWLETNVPREWEADLNRIIGRRSDQGVSREEIRARLLDKRSLKSDLEEARTGAEKWNKGVEPGLKRFHITKAQAKRWGQLRTFKENLERVKQSYDQFLRERKKKKDKPVYPAQPPVIPPLTPPPPIFPGQDTAPPLPVPPKKPQSIPMTQAAKEALADFLAARTEALAHDKYAAYLPMGPFNKYNLWQGISRHGFRFYGAVRQFVILSNLTAIGNKIITEARDMWSLVSGRSEFMTIRFTFSAQGSGNPFYPGAFEPDKNEFNFFNRNTDIMPETRFIERAVRAILHEAWEVAQETMLFFEHYEIVKSVPFHHKERGGEGDE